MRGRSFERRLLVALVLFSLVPSLLILAGGAYLLSRTVSLHASAAAWEQTAASARPLIERAEATGEPALQRPARELRGELSQSLVQASRWEYLNRRALRTIPLLALGLAVLLAWLAVRAARGIAREMARPIHELVGWAHQVAREEPLPPARPDDPAERDEFAALRSAFRTMAQELAVSRQRALEAERTRAWIRLARGVAHELKNSLTPLRLGARALERAAAGAPGTAHEVREPLEVIRAEADRLEELARAFSHFGRLPEGALSEIDLVEQWQYVLRTHVPPELRHRLRAPVDLPHVHGHYDALSRAWANLVLNAAEAMDGEGALTVQLSTVGEAVEVRVLDQGPGIDPDDLERIWEPDFTTKSRGTGLGLALVRQTLQAHGGGIWARNRPEGGAEFRVLLPLRLPARASEPQRP